MCAAPAAAISCPICHQEPTQRGQGVENIAYLHCPDQGLSECILCLKCLGTYIDSRCRQIGLWLQTSPDCLFCKGKTVHPIRAKINGQMVSLEPTNGIGELITRIKRTLEDARGAAIRDASANQNIGQLHTLADNGPTALERTENLRSAIENGCFDSVKFWLTQYPPVGSNDSTLQDKELKSMFLAAVMGGRDNIALAIFEKIKGLVNDRERTDWVTTAANQNLPKTVIALVLHGFVEKRAKLWALEKMAAQGHKEAVEVILHSERFDSQELRLALGAAAAKGHAEIVTLLQEAIAAPAE